MKDYCNQLFLFGIVMDGKLYTTTFNNYLLIFDYDSTMFIKKVEFFSKDNLELWKIQKWSETFLLCATTENIYFYNTIKEKNENSLILNTSIDWFIKPKIKKFIIVLSREENCLTKIDFE